MKATTTIVQVRGADIEVDDVIGCRHSTGLRWREVWGVFTDVDAFKKVYVPQRMTWGLQSLYRISRWVESVLPFDDQHLQICLDSLDWDGDHWIVLLVGDGLSTNASEADTDLMILHKHTLIDVQQRTEVT